MLPKNFISIKQFVQSFNFKKVNELKFQELQEETIRFEVGSTAEAGRS